MAKRALRAIKTRAPIVQHVTDNPKKAYGDPKPSIHTIPMAVMVEVAEVMRGGAGKYGVRNWRKQPIKASTYYSAIFRHLVQWYEDVESVDADSGRSHLAHIIANAMLVLDAEKHSTLIDDREFSEVLVKE